MPLSTRSGSPSGDSGASPDTLPLAAAAAPAAATATAGHPGVHHGVRREGRGARGYGGEVGDHTPRIRRAAFRTLRGLVRGAHRAHQVEAILAACALVLVESHPIPPLGSLISHHIYCTAPRAPRGAPPSAGTMGTQRWRSDFRSYPELSSVNSPERGAESVNQHGKLRVHQEAGARLSGVMGKGEPWVPATLFISHLALLSRPEAHLLSHNPPTAIRDSSVTIT